MWLRPGRLTRYGSGQGSSGREIERQATRRQIMSKRSKQKPRPLSALGFWFVVLVVLLTTIGRTQEPPDLRIAAAIETLRDADEGKLKEAIKTLKTLGPPAVG